MSNTLTITTPVRLEKKQVEYASLDNPTLTWMEFIFTDDLPNANKVGIKADQFASILQTGILMPLKAAEGTIAPGHEGSTPLGVIANLAEKYNETLNKTDILGKAALWSEERKEDIEQIKTAYASGDPLEISWELLFSEDVTDEEGIRWLQAPIVRAATLVGVPAYSGRTPVLAVASVEDVNVSETKTEETQVELEELTQKLAEATSRITELEASLKTLTEEASGLREFKASVEAKEAKAALLNTRLAAFAESGLTFSAEDINAKQDAWLSLNDEAFNFLVGELKGLKVATAAVETPVISVPATTGSRATATTAEILAGLKQLNQK
jgi:hypothetical protein